MARFSVGGAATAGFGLIGKRPVSTLGWGLALLVLGVAPLLALAPLISGDLLKLMAEQSAMGAGGQMDPETLQRVMQLQSGMILFNIGSWVWGTFTNALVAAAIFRAVLEPKARKFAYLRLGGRELWLTLLFLVETVLAYIVVMALSMAVAILAVIGVVSVKAGGGGGDGTMVLIAVGAGVLVLAIIVWLALRLSMAGPMTFAEGQFRLFESWTLTRGHGWGLLGVAVLVVIFVIVIELVVAGLAFAAVLGLGLAPEWLMDPVRLEALFNGRAPAKVQTMLLELTPLLTVVCGAWALVAGMVMALFCAPLARIYADLTRPDLPRPAPESRLNLE